MNNKKVLVTGGAGFIGSNLVENLLINNYSVVVLDNFHSGNIQNLDGIKNNYNNLEVIDGDICDKNLVDKLIKNTSCVFHLAALVSVAESMQNKDEYERVNVGGTKNILDACVKYNSKFIFASSAAVYGNDKTEIKSESLKTIPISNYGQNKLDIENICINYENTKGLEYCCFRNFNVYGPKQDINSSYAAVIPIFINKSLENNNLLIYGNGEQTRDFIYVGDVSDAYIIAFESNFNGIYNLGCNGVLSVNDLANLIVGMTNSSSEIKYLNSRDGDIKHSRANVSKYSNISNWNAKIKLEVGIKNTILYYEKNKR